MTDTPILDQAIVDEAKAMMKAKFPTMVQYFFEDAEMYLAAVREGFTEKNVEKIVSPAHTLKSSSRQMGALRLSDIAKEIEHLARDQVSGGGDIQVFTPLLANLEQVLTETKAAFK